MKTELAALREQEPVGELEVFTGHDRLTTFRQLPEGKHTLYLSPMPSVPEGWQLVPVEPTKAMRKAGERVRRYDKHNNDEFMPDIVYASMLAAAPKPGEGND